MEQLINRIGFSRSTLEYSNLELIDLLKGYVPDRVPGILRRSRSLMTNVSQAWILNRGYKIDFLWCSFMMGGYMGINFQKHPFQEDWEYYKEKTKEIEEIYLSGLYDRLNIKRMGVCLCAPLGENEVESEEEEIEEEMFFNFLEGMETSKEFIAPTGLVDKTQIESYNPHSAPSTVTLSVWRPYQGKLIDSTIKLRGRIRVNSSPVSLTKSN